jgi:hypothetical protein
MTIMRSVFTAVALALLTAATASAQGFGTIKGQFVYDGAPPKRAPLQVTKDQAVCLAKGPLLSEEWVVDGPTKGVRWIAVWVAADMGGKAALNAPLALHPSVAVVPKKPYIIDQPCCKFEPHVGIMREGQDLVGKNPSPVAHNLMIVGGKIKNINPLMPPNSVTRLDAKECKSHHFPATIACGIHPWMKGYLFVLPHPYFAVTDDKGNFEIKNVPAGKLRLVAWHDSGFVIKDADAAKAWDGKGITVEADKTLDLGQIKVK